MGIKAGSKWMASKMPVINLIRITAHFEGIGVIPIRYPTPRPAGLEAGFYKPRVSDAQISAD